MLYKVFHLSAILILMLSLSFAPVHNVSATMAQAVAGNIIVNGDFESGNTGFTSDYTFSPGDIGPAALYDVLSDPSSAHPAAVSFGDHTSGQGLMMAINGADSAGAVVWSQSVPVTASTDYEFSAWVTSWYPAAPAQLQFLINGNVVGTITAPLTAGSWQQFAVTWNSGASTSASIEIIDLNTDNGGNDFALDDLALRVFNCDTPTFTPTYTSTSTSTPTGTLTDTPTGTATNTSTSTPTDEQTNTPTATSTSTFTATPTSDLGQLKLCKETAAGIDRGEVFSMRVGNHTYRVPAGYCILAGTFLLNTEVTVQEHIPAGYYVAGIDVKPDSRRISRDVTIGKVVVRIGAGVTEVIYKNRVVAMPTSTPRPTNTPTPTPNCAPNCTPTPVPMPTGRMQICKESEGPRVSGDFTFRFNARSKTVPVGACSLISSVNVGTLTISEDARAGYEVADIYTIPADRLISKDLNTRTVTVTIVPGDASTQTIIVFVNRASTTQTIMNMVSGLSTIEVRMSESSIASLMQFLGRGWRS